MSCSLTSVSARYARLTAFAIIHMLFSSLAWRLYRNDLQHLSFIEGLDCDK
jgi:hypothetical protein